MSPSDGAQRTKREKSCAGHGLAFAGAHFDTKESGGCSVRSDRRFLFSRELNWRSSKLLRLLCCLAECLLHVGLEHVPNSPDVIRQDDDRHDHPASGESVDKARESAQQTQWGKNDCDDSGPVLAIEQPDGEKIDCDAGGRVVELEHPNGNKDGEGGEEKENHASEDPNSRHKACAHTCARGTICICSGIEETSEHCAAREHEQGQYGARRRSDEIQYRDNRDSCWSQHSITSTKRWHDPARRSRRKRGEGLCGVR